MFLLENLIDFPKRIISIFRALGHDSNAIKNTASDLTAEFIWPSRLPLRELLNIYKKLLIQFAIYILIHVYIP